VVKNIIVLFMLGVCVVACAQLEALGKYAAEHSGRAAFAARQAAYTYIEQGRSYDDKVAKAARVVEVMEAAERELQGNPTATADTVLVVLSQPIMWGRLTIQEKIILEEVVAILRERLDATDLDPAARFGVRHIIESTRGAALSYVNPAP